MCNVCRQNFDEFLKTQKAQYESCMKYEECCGAATTHGDYILAKEMESMKEEIKSLKDELRSHFHD